MYKLIDLCENITSGQIMSRVARSETKKGAQLTPTDIIATEKAIVPKAISDGVINDVELTDVDLVKSVDDNKRTSAGDIIIKLSTPYDSAVVLPTQEGLIATSFCALIRNISKDYLPEFICAYLNTSEVKDQLRASMAGATVPLLRISDIKQIDIPQVSIEQQERVVTILKLNARKKQILSDMLTQCRQLDTSIVMTAIKKGEEF